MDDDLTFSTFIMEDGSNNSGILSLDLLNSDINSDYSEQEEQEEVVTESSDYSVILTDIHEELVSIHSDILVLDNSINNVSLCIEQFANVTVELFVIGLIIFFIGTVFNSLLHFFK